MSRELLASALAACGLAVSVGVGAAAQKLFSVADEIGLAHFGDPYFGGNAQAFLFSPDGEYFAAFTDRGRLDLDRVEDTLSIYSTADVSAFLKRPADAEPPKPYWVVRATSDDGPVITEWRWLADSSGIAY